MDTTPITARLSAIADSVNALKSLQALTYEEFVREHVLHAAAERDFQVAIQAALDIGSIILAEQAVSPAESYKDVFLKLAQSGADKRVKIWDIATGRLLHTLSGHYRRRQRGAAGQIQRTDPALLG